MVCFTPDRDLFGLMHLLSGALTQSLAQTRRIDTLSGGFCRSSDMASVLDTMIAVFSKGFEAIRGGLAKRDRPCPSANGP